MTSAAPIVHPHEVKSAAAILAEDVICQSFIQSSSTLAYACLLIRQKKYDLATHVLHSLEAKQASRFKDMVFYLQAQIGIETGEYAVVKRRLVPRVHQHPNDMVALSLLESCIFLEWDAWLRENPSHASTVAASSSAGTAAPAHAPAKEVTDDSPKPASAPRAEMPSAHASMQSASPVSSTQPPQSSHAAAGLAGRAARAEAYAAVSVPHSAHGEGEPRLVEDFGIYQGLAADDNTQALAFWNTESRKFRSTSHNAALEPLVSLLPQIMPGSLLDACAALDSGEIHKICFSFHDLTVTSLHMGAEHLGLVTGNINQSLLIMVRAENLFLKHAASVTGRTSATVARPGAPQASGSQAQTAAPAASAGAGSPGHSMEFAPND